MRPRMPPLGLFVARAREQIVQGVTLEMRAGVIGLRGDRPDDNGPRSDAGIFIPPETAFPDLAATKETLKDLLSDLDVDEVLFTAARLNLILTEQLRDENAPWWQRQRRLQSELASSILPPDALGRVDSYVRSERIHAGNWIIFHRGQLIEFMRWAALYCRIVNEGCVATLAGVAGSLKRS